MKENQARQNIEYILDGYVNGMVDCGEDMYPQLNEKQVIDYVKYELYDIKVTGNGESCLMLDGVCDDLKFLSNEKLDKMILDYAKECGVLKNEG